MQHRPTAYRGLPGRFVSLALGVGAWRWVVSLLAGVALAGGLSGASWLLLSERPSRSPGQIDLTIPPGTAALVRTSTVPSVIPSSLTFVHGDTLVVRNQDSVDHLIGPFRVPAGETVTIDIERASPERFSCTIHPTGYLGVVVQRRTEPQSLLWPTLIIGLPLGTVFAAVQAIAMRIGSS